MSSIKAKFDLWLEKFSEAWLACAICMVQGDLSVFSWSHAWIATQTGTATGLAVVICSFIPNTREIHILWLTGLLAATADLLVHNLSKAGYIESICTGIGAMLLALAYQKLRKRDGNQ